jgi:hypothetical protein
MRFICPPQKIGHKVIERLPGPRGVPNAKTWVGDEVLEQLLGQDPLGLSLTFSVH